MREVSDCRAPEVTYHGAPAPSCWWCACLALRRRGRGPGLLIHGGGGPLSTPASPNLFYHENRAKCARKLLRYSGYPCKVMLFPDEGWARSASSSYWTLTPTWWSTSRCHVTEIAGTRRYTAHARMVDTDTGSLFIVGSFKRSSAEPDFKLTLTSQVSMADFNMGYSMTGSLERGNKKTNTFQMTHFAVVRRRDHEKK